MIIEEGGIKIKVEEETLKSPSSKSKVFYNPRMKINRDLTIIFLKSFFKKPIRILDGMAATGIRSLRILKEIEVEEIIINDISKDSVERIKENIKLNNVDSDKIRIENKDINKLCLEEKGFDYIDIDPFGSPVKYISNPIMSLKYKGVLGITATDLTALTGSKPSALFRKYSVIGIKTDFFKEFGIRVLIKKVFEKGMELGYFMKPLFSYYKEHHYRVFFQKLKFKNKYLNYISNIVYCENCLNRSIFGNEIICKICNKKMKIIGPIYVKSINEKNLLEKMKEIGYREFLEKIIKESEYKSPWYFSIRFFAKKYKLRKIEKMEYYLKEFEGSRTHFDPLGIKTDIDPQIIINLFRNR